MDTNELSYNSLPEETKVLMNKAMDIYSVIKDKNIEKEVKDVIGTKEHSFSRLDKKVFSIYLASFLADTSLKTILDEFDEIKKEDLFSFIDITEEHIGNIEDFAYESYYDDNFKLTLNMIKEKGSRFKDFEAIIPEVVFTWIGRSFTFGSEVIEYFMKEYVSNHSFFADEHPSFQIVASVAKQKGAIKERKSAFSLNRGFPFFGVPQTEVDMGNQVQKEKAFDINHEKLWDVLDDVKAKFIGQEEAVEHLFYNIVNNQDLAYQNDVNDGQRSIVFLDGPTGTGKTAITREITKQLDIPFVSTSATNYSSTGYVGGNLTDTLKDLLDKANGDIEKAQRGIVVFDEFDKMAYNRSSGGLEMKKAVQQQMLDFMGGGKYNISTGMGFFGGGSVEFDTSKLTFICLAALTDLRENKQEDHRPIGFGEQENKKQEEKSYSITPQDLMDLGLERELVGRFNTYLHTEEYSKESLLKILKESTISPMLGFEKWITSKNKKLVTEDATYEAIVDAAYELNTGARSLQTVMNNIRTPFLKEVLRGREDTITLDEATVRNINNNTMNRKGRM